MARGVAKLVVVLLCAVVLAPAAEAARSTPQASLNALGKGVLAQINQLRRSHGLVPLRLSSSLTAAAVQHSREMAVDGYFAHESFDGSSFDKRLARYYRPASFRFWSVGENLVWAAPELDAPGALNLWWNSPEHRRNMLDPRWREIGVSALHVPAAPGVYGGGAATIVTTDFGVRR